MEATTLEVLKKLKDYVDLVVEQVTINSEAVVGLGEFTQAMGNTVMQIIDLVKNNLRTMKGVFGEVTDSLELIELAQNTQLELINSIQTLVNFNTGLGVVNLVLILALGIYVIRRK